MALDPATNSPAHSVWRVAHWRDTLKRAVNRSFDSLINAVRRLRYVDARGGFEIYRFPTSDGTFDYELYRRVQTAGNKRKINYTWAQEQNIVFLSNYVRAAIGQPRFGLCHGTRRGKEQAWFRRSLHCEVIGTEISDTAEQFPHTIKWDFHDTKAEWIDAVDFIYSNAFDHCYDPDRCLNAWMSCIRPGGLCVLEHTSYHERANQLDPFGAHISQMPHLIRTWGRGKFDVREIINAPSVPRWSEYVRFIIVERLQVPGRTLPVG